MSKKQKQWLEIDEIVKNDLKQKIRFLPNSILYTGKKPYITKHWIIETISEKRIKKIKKIIDNI